MKDINLDINSKKELNRIVDFVKKKVKYLKRDGVILGLSGGIDSAVVAAIAKMAFPRNSLALILPDKDSNKKKIKDAIKLARHISIRYKKIDITESLESLGTYDLIPRKLRDRKILAKLINDVREKLGMGLLQGIRPEERPDFMRKLSLFYMPKLRTRMIMIYKYAFIMNYAVLGTTDKTEYFIGEYDPHGDGACDIEVISHLYKTQVKRLGKYLNIPQEIIEQKSSPDMLPGIDAYDMINIPYKRLDKTIEFILRRYPIRLAKEYELLFKEIKEVKIAIRNSNLRREPPFSLPKTRIISPEQVYIRDFS